MITIPVYEMTILPEVTFYFKKDLFDDRDMSVISEGDEVLFLMLKEHKKRELITEDDVYSYGVSAVIDHIDEDGNIRIRTKKRVQILSVEIEDGEIHTEAVINEEIQDLSDADLKIRFEKIKTDLLKFVRRFQWGIWIRTFIVQWKNMNEMVCGLASYLNLSWEEKYAILAAPTCEQRCDKIEKAIYEFMEMTRVGEEVQLQQKNSHEQAYRETAIKKQISILQKELDSMHPENESDVDRFEKLIHESGMNEEARREALKVLNRLKQEGKDGHEYGMLYDYLDFVTKLAWKVEKEPPIDLVKAEEILREDHYGLDKVKERIIEQMAVMSLNKKQSGSILLFSGPPGTGKTSIGQSIARALERKYVRISLGGIRDEAEIRGHRRTYIGAMPGRIMEGMKRSASMNPVVVLDEVDKLARDYNGDPSSALLEVLDPEQNVTFTDHYMNVPYDLSQVLFLCTANTTDTIPEPLLNRMEVIPFNGYTDTEKYKIAKRHLIPKSMADTGISQAQLEITDEALKEIISDYTAEAGVRGLKKQIDHLCRYAAVQYVKRQTGCITVAPGGLKKILGNKLRRHEHILEEKQPGVVTGLAWTPAGGEILFIETSLTKGSGEVLMTGQLGDVMKESAYIAVTLAKGLYPKEAGVLTDHDLHIHVPDGAVQKDGPSAGITMVTALCSLITNRAVSPECAMTGEISLRGSILPIGGLPEKLMAAQRAGIQTVLIPSENQEDLEDISPEVKDTLNILPMKKITDVLNVVLP
jgi:ATP-dependent Lon protease